MAVPKKKTRATRPLVRTARARAVHMRRRRGGEKSAAPSRCDLKACIAGGSRGRCRGRGRADLGDEDAGEEEDAGGGEGGEAGVEGGAFVEGFGPV
jgi:hypothetical protein